MTSQGMVVGHSKKIKMGDGKGCLDRLTKRLGGGLLLLQVGMAERERVRWAK